MRTAPQSARPLRERLVRGAGLAATMMAAASFATCVGEIVVRVAAPQQLIEMRPELWQPAESLGHVHRPNVSVRINTGEREITVHTDGDGMRIGASGRRDARVRVLILGDSFMEALQVEYEQSTAYLLERGLVKGLGDSVVVRNAGVVAWDPNQYLIRARGALRREAFSLVVVAVFVGNDAVPWRTERVPPRAPVERLRLRIPHVASRDAIVRAVLAPINDVFEAHSHLFVLAKNQLSVLRMRLGLSAEYFPQEYRKQEVAEARWANTAEIAKEIATVAAAHGAPTLFVLVPESFQVYERDFHRYVRGFGIDSNTVDVNQPTRRLREEFAARNLQVLDVLPEFRVQAVGRPRLFGSIDKHLSPEGHKLLAELLVPRAAALLHRPTDHTP